MGNWLEADRYHEGELTIWLLEEAGGEVAGIYGDLDWAIRNADWSTEGSGEPTVVREVVFRRESAEEVYRADPEDDADGDDPDSGEDERDA